MNLMSSYALFSGIGIDESEPLQSFDSALLSAGLSDYNLLKVSSILPPNCKQEKVIDIAPGSPLLAAYSVITSRGQGVISAALAIGVPEDNTRIGVIMECSGNCCKEETENRAKSMVNKAMGARNIKIKEIVCISTEAMLSEKHHSTTVAIIAMW